MPNPCRLALIRPGIIPFQHYATKQVWEASGHVAGFVDPMVDCKVSKLRYRADQLFYAKARLNFFFPVGGWMPKSPIHRLTRPAHFTRCASQVELLDDGEVVGYVSMLDSGDLHADAEKQVAKLVKKAGKQGKALKTPFEIKVGWGGPACLTRAHLVGL